ncbi:Glycosyltransferase involved in cell wall bisynthesis [Faunimonas pinastri]|uniref:Glycosyltransferase involved in cell wall bisynthesis n=1 Tax=Faunimonas pinastri TaxID=1855383 RepID=A0A1H9QU48_9HYPH|nr:glycosyltransferase family 4 protein [Faunimonas pinastri]SER63960.1 Glycosyltransferase involved in cell wall bisynthesis [Faunimonas pinastri]
MTDRADNNIPGAPGPLSRIIQAIGVQPVRRLSNLFVPARPLPSNSSAGSCASVRDKHPAAPPSVLFVDHTGELGGAELCLLDLARTYSGRHKVLLFQDGPLRERLADAGVNVEVIEAGRHLLSVRRASGLRNLWKAIPTIAGLARRIAREARDFDIVYANSQKAFICSVLAAGLARRPLVWHLHDILTGSGFSQTLKSAAVHLANRGASLVIVNSVATADAFAAAGGRTDHTAIVYNGIDPRPYLHAQPSPRPRLPDGSAPPLVGIFGRLAAWKGQHVLIDALAELDGVHALIVGDSLFGEVAYADELKQRIEAHGLQDRVHFLGFRQDVAPLMKSVDVVVHASTAPEPFGRVIAEAMMAGRPVVAAANGGALELIQEGVTGFLVKADNPAALAEKLRGVLADPVGAAEIAGQGNKAAVRAFTLSAVTKEIEALLARVGRPHPTGAPHRGTKRVGFNPDEINP